MGRARLRDLGITIGKLPPAAWNAITDVPGVLVGHTTLIYDEPNVARTGLTVILPRNAAAGPGIWEDHCFAAIHAFNGNGEMTGSHWIASVENRLRHRPAPKRPISSPCSVIELAWAPT